jgi:environmental stress-induced protein Ves/predicted GIY-YIG superfamily endonuclease
MMSDHRRVPWAYLLRCADGSLYGGAAKDLSARLGQHDLGRASRYTRSRLPVALAWARELSTWGDALREENRVKALPRAAKEALVAADAPRLTPLAASSYRDMPWKNGRGVTTEIARRPAGDGPFDWRVSTAAVVESGPFSPFPGLDRVLVVVQGEGLSLSHDGGAAVTLAPLEPYAFSGDAQTMGGPIGGPVRDFNVLWRRDRVSAAVSVVRAASTVALAPTTLCFAVAGSVVVVVPGGETRLGEGESLIAETATASAAVLRPEPGAIVIRVALAPA